jgi:hypothetical protein
MGVVKKGASKLTENQFFNFIPREKSMAKKEKNIQ